MHLSKVSIINYRNFSNAKFILSKKINTIIGENGSGKTNFFRAIRLLLDDTMKRSATQLAERDFFRGLDDWRGHWIIISLEFDEVSQDEAIQALFLHGTGDLESGEECIDRSTYNLIFRPNIQVRSALSSLLAGDSTALQAIRDKISIDDYETVITGKSTADFNDRRVYESIAGNFNNVVFPSILNPPEIGCRVPQLLSMPKEISFTFVQALRDVVTEFYNNRTNPLFKLLKSKSNEINQLEFDPIISKVNSLNTSIESLTDVKEIRRDIKRTINEAVGVAYSPTSISIKSELPDEAESLFQSLKLFIAESEDGHEGAINEMSLGGANLIYLTLKLLEFKYQHKKNPIANFLLIEEPEAHIHTHVQKSLFDRISFSNTQIIYSTHSSHVSEASNIHNVNILGKVDGVYEVFQQAYGLEISQAKNIQRYLDAIRSNLLFAKSVILVEGDAEEVLVPIMIKEYLGVSLDELGISLVNIRSTGFKNIALLFHDERIKKKCSIITDLDKSFFDTTEQSSDNNALKKSKEKAINSEKLGESRKESLDEFAKNNKWINIYYANHTFEVDLLCLDNVNLYVQALSDIYSDEKTILESQKELESDQISIFGLRALKMANYVGKGWFSIILGKYVSYHSIIPDYILDAVIFAHGSFDKQLMCAILSYRISKLKEELDRNRSMASTNQDESPESTDYFTLSDNAMIAVDKDFKSYRDTGVKLDTIKQQLKTHFPKDSINIFLDRV
jgi:putative ATP-dependent endonuclease of OLD family